MLKVPRSTLATVQQELSPRKPISFWLFPEPCLLRFSRFPHFPELMVRGVGSRGKANASCCGSHANIYLPGDSTCAGTNVFGVSSSGCSSPIAPASTWSREPQARRDAVVDDSDSVPADCPLFSWHCFDFFVSHARKVAHAMRSTIFSPLCQSTAQ